MVGTAQAEQAVIYAPRAEASSDAIAHQGPYTQQSDAKIINGVTQYVTAGPGGTATTGGTATSGYAQTSMEGGTNYGAPLHSDAYASANLATGRLAATVNASGPNNFGSPLGFAAARLDDTIYFNNTTSGYVTLNFTYHFDGQISDPNLGTAGGPGNPSGYANLAFSCDYFYCYNAANEAIRFASGPQNVANANMIAFFDRDGISGFGENGYQSLPPGQQTNFYTQTDNIYGSGGNISGLISASFLIPPGQTSLGFRGDLNLDCRGGSICEFGHTGQFGFGAIPDGLTIGSASGVFLTDLGVPIPGGVPEPATWTMMILGFGMVGAGMRRRSERALATS